MQGVISIVNSFKNATVWKRKAKSLNPIEAYKDIDGNAKKQYGLAQHLYNGRMPGAQQMEQNILTSNANSQNNINRNSADSSQSLAMNAAAQGQTDQAFANLGIMEAQNKMDMLGNLNNQSANMQNEGNMVHADKVRRFNDNTSRKDAYLSAYQANKTKGIEDLNGLVQSIIKMFAGGMGGGPGAPGGAPYGTMQSPQSMTGMINTGAAATGYRGFTFGK